MYKRCILFAGLLLAILCSSARPALAAGILVNTTAQKPGAAGDCTLGEAIDAANTDTAVDGCIAGAGADTITLPAGTYTLTQIDNNHPFTGANGLPLVTSDLVISGAGSDTTIIERAANAPAFRILSLGPGSLQNVTVRGGNHSDGAGVNGGVTLDHVVVANNTGDGVYTEGTISILHSNLRDNSGNGLNVGSAHSHPYNLVNVLDSRVTGNGGFGLAAMQAQLAVEQSIISNNEGGGVSADSVSLRVAASSIANNNGIGIANYGGASFSDLGAAVEITKSAIYGNRARGFQHKGARGGTINVTNSTIARNGGGISFRSSTALMTLTNSTITANTAKSGAGILHGTEKGKVVLKNTILASNTSKQGADCLGKLASRGHNILASTAGCDIVLRKTDNLAKPRLGAWLDDGTPGNGHFPLLPASPAINRASTAGCPLIDQLSHPRFKSCDIGAIEYIPAPISE